MRTLPLILGAPWLFVPATLATGILALASMGRPFLADTGRIQRQGTANVVRVPNARGWGARRVAAGVAPWGSVAGSGHRANTLDHRFWAVVPYVVIRLPVVAALVPTC